MDMPGSNGVVHSAAAGQLPELLVARGVLLQQQVLHMQVSAVE